MLRKSLPALLFVATFAVACNTRRRLGSFDADVALGPDLPWPIRCSHDVTTGVVDFHVNVAAARIGIRLHSPSNEAEPSPLSCDSNGLEPRPSFFRSHAFRKLEGFTCCHGAIAARSQRSRRRR